MRRWLIVLVLVAAPAYAQEPNPGAGAAGAAEGGTEGKPAVKAEAAAAKPEGEAAKPEAEAVKAEAAKPADDGVHPDGVEAKPEPAGGAVHPGAAAHPADPDAPVVHVAPTGHEGAAPAAEHEHAENHHPHGIVNWFSWDYGPGSKDPSHRYWPPPFGFALINFAIFFGLMMRLGKKPLVDYVAARHERIKHELDEAGRLRREAEARLAELDKKLAGLDREVETIVMTVRKEAEEEKARILAAADEQGVRIQKEAERQIAAEIDRQRKELSRAVVEAAMTQAEALLAQNFSAADQKKTSDAYVAQLEKGLS